MSRNWPLPPCEAVCLVRLRSSTQNGGTLIAEDVRDRAAHERRICHPDGYRPAACPRCGGRQLHVHDYRERILRAEPDDPVVTTVRHACVGCHAIWQILPAFVARCLWRSWQVVADAVDITTRVARRLMLARFHEGSGRLTFTARLGEEVRVLLPPPSGSTLWRWTDPGVAVRPFRPGVEVERDGVRVHYGEFLSDVETSLVLRVDRVR